MQESKEEDEEAFTERAAQLFVGRVSVVNYSLCSVLACGCWRGPPHCAWLRLLHFMTDCPITFFCCTMLYHTSVYVYMYTDICIYMILMEHCPVKLQVFWVAMLWKLRSRTSCRV